ncbi:IS66 family transposase [Eubacteriaceae bacterium ES3]|nr:IS66 family transposase [Eubacteriaceae bacterium ES3]WKY46728.1 IS66 family transposase [Eubacteriaceae bacterium ES3]WKY47214.1 IS66 family transposase [Eubacteriaceae bacterium ES3]WKY47691.1 IS66 family transposase [Eubacteriaceae bacterium ES3]WKY49017.1 IS66 family transposase [Eubacteriaceae bacterium ES3]
MTGKRYKHQMGKENSLTETETQDPALDFLSVITELQSENTRLNSELEEAQAKIKWYEEQLRLNAQKRFGKSADTVIIENQISFFNEPEVTKRPEQEEPSIEVATHRRKKRGLNRDSFDDLPVERIVYDLNEDEKVCPVCDHSLHQMKEEVRQELKVIPAKVVRVEHVRKVYACRHCQDHEIKTPIITAKAPNPVISGSFVSPSLLAYILYQKFAAALPLYRQEQTFKHFGIELSRATMSNWIIKGSERYLEPLYRLMKKHLEKESFLMADETSLKVLTKDGEACTSKAYMWLYRPGKYGKPMALFEYQPSRSGKHPKNFLENFKGILQTDGYDGYNSVTDITRVCCFAHARRQYTDALKALPKGTIKTETEAWQAVQMIGEMFVFEKALLKEDLTPKERKERREKELKPLMTAYFAWVKLMSQNTLPKSAFGKALNYSLKHQTVLENILLDGQCELSTNIAEQQIKPFVVARKNFLFCKTANGAKASATAFSLIQSAKLNELNPYEYLKFLFERLPDINCDDEVALEPFLPWSDQLPEICRQSLAQTNQHQ